MFLGCSARENTIDRRGGKALHSGREKGNEKAGLREIGRERELRHEKDEDGKKERKRPIDREIDR